ncbi:MAG: KamA family radical SAM protein [Lachnospiraceae bacterium]|nr:KamA family radical SAM protein [Lachnospiraceae bacterium]
MDWLEELKNNITSAEELKQILHFSEEETSRMGKILDQYPLSLGKYYLSIINMEDKDDPIKKMCIPSITETDVDGSFDTSGEGTNTVMTGLQHKYAQTALILSTSLCAMYCRHCFRKRLVGTSDQEIAVYFDEIMGYINEHKEISNVLISGGDSFLNKNEVIEKYLNRLCEMEHLDFIRFGTRTPVVLPSRIYGDEELLNILEKYNSKKTIYVVTQFNHPNEITEQAVKAVNCLERIGITVKNQAVLLKGVNDNPETMATLLRKLTSVGIDPYYVFQCRPVTGVKNQFQVPIIKGYKIIEDAKAMVNGIGKAFRYCMSHESGKMEILGEVEPNKMIFKYQEAKNPENYGKLFEYKISDSQCWLD